MAAAAEGFKWGDAEGIGEVVDGGVEGNEPREGEERGRGRGEAEALVGLDGAPAMTDCRKTDIVGEGEALDDIFCEVDQEV